LLLLLLPGNSQWRNMSWLGSYRGKIMGTNNWGVITAEGLSQQLLVNPSKAALVGSLFLS